MRRIPSIRLTRGLGRLMIVTGVVLCVASAGIAAYALTSITTPNTTPFVVPGDALGNPVPFTVVATGFPAGASVLAEQCDGIPSTRDGLMFPPTGHGLGIAIRDNDLGDPIFETTKP